MDFHKRLRKFRKDKDLSYQRIADACNVSWQTVQQWCKDDGPFPKIENLEPLASLLETTPWYLLFGVDASGNLSNNEGNRSLSDEADELIQCVIRLDGVGELARKTFALHAQLLGLSLSQKLQEYDSTGKLLEQAEHEAEDLMSDLHHSGGKDAAGKRRRS